MSDRLYGAADKAPRYLQHRFVAGAADTLPETVKAHGIVLEDFEYAHIQIVPSAGADPEATVQFWCESAGAFIDDVNEISYPAKGVGVAWEMSIPVRGRIIFVSLTSGIGVGDSCKVFVAGYRNGSR